MKLKIFFLHQFSKMDFSIVYESLSPEELDIEYKVRGLVATQAEIEKMFLELLQKEYQNPNYRI